MANTSAVYAIIDTNLKENADDILFQLRISPSGIIQMLYSQVVMTRGVPFDFHLPSVKPTAIGDMIQVQLDAELTKGIESLEIGKAYSVDEVDAELVKKFDI